MRSFIATALRLRIYITRRFATTSRPIIKKLTTNGGCIHCIAPISESSCFFVESYINDMDRYTRTTPRSHGCLLCVFSSVDAHSRHRILLLLFQLQHQVQATQCMRCSSFRGSYHLPTPTSLCVMRASLIDVCEF